MPTVHPSAVVGPDVDLADDVIVGPGCILDTATGPITLGPGCRLIANVFLQGPITLGANNTCYPNTYLGFPPQDRSFAPDTPGQGTVIGADNIFREGTSIHRATRDHPTTLGDRNYLMAHSHVGHDCIVGHDNTLANAACLGGHVHVADRATLGGYATVHQFCRVGRLAMISGLAGISQDLPPFCVTYDTRTLGSLNIIGLRRAGLRDHIPALKQAFNTLFRSRLPVPAALDQLAELNLNDPLVDELADFCRNSKRGYLPYASRGVRDSA